MTAGSRGSDSKWLSAEQKKAPVLHIWKGVGPSKGMKLWEGKWTEVNHGQFVKPLQIFHTPWWSC